MAIKMGYLPWGGLWSNYITVICSRITIPKKNNLYHAPLKSFCFVAQNWWGANHSLPDRCRRNYKILPTFFMSSIWEWLRALLVTLYSNIQCIRMGQEQKSSLLLVEYDILDGICKRYKKWLCAECGDVSELKMISCHSLIRSWGSVDFSAN